jgi:tetratricopeptide (TPR) repeat protein
MTKSNSGKDGRVARAAEEVESTLERTAQYCLADLPPGHYARRTGWHIELRRAPNGFIRYAPGALERLEPLRRQLEIARVQAEALLVAERLNEVIHGAQQREELTRRALGILPSAEADRLREVFACPELQPRHFARSATATMAAFEQVERECGRATALTYCMLSLAGMRQEEEITRYGERLDRVFDRIISAPPVLRALEQVIPDELDEKFRVLFQLLTAVREQLWQMKPNRVSVEFLLPQLIDNYLGAQSGAGNSLGLAILDSIIIGKLGFHANYLVDDGVLRLEIPAANHKVCWELTRPEPLSTGSTVGGRLVDPRDLFAITYGSLATMCFTRGMLDRSVEAYQLTLELNPTSLETRTSLAICLLRSQLPNDALQELRACLELDANSPEVHHQIGNAHAMLSNWPKAIHSFKRALRIRPDMAEVCNNLGFAYMHAGNNAQAVIAFQAAIERRADYYQAHFNLANLHMEQQQYDLAIKHYRETLRIEPKLVAAYYNMGRAHYEKHELDDAIHSYDKAVTLNPKHFGAWHNLGISYRDKGQTDKAVEALEKAVTINPNLMR